MNNEKTKTVLMTEANAFNRNASLLVLSRGEDGIPELLDTLGFECEKRGSSYVIACPVCEKSNAWIATSNPIVHPIYWGCYGRGCLSKTSRFYVKNLLGLVRACVEDKSLATAYRAIADFLGYARSYDITNLDEATIGAPKAAESVQPPLWVVPDADARDVFERAGLKAVTCEEPIPPGRDVFGEDAFAKLGLAAYELEFVPPGELRRKAEAIMAAVRN